MRRPLSWLLAGGLALVCCAGAAGGTDGLAAVGRALERFRPDEVRGEVERMLAADPDPVTAGLLAEYFFSTGEYRRAVELLERAGEDHPLTGPIRFSERFWQAPLVRQAGRVRFVLSDPIDELLVPEGTETLERALAALEPLFGERLDGPVTVEVYPDVASAAAALGIERQHLIDSGTIAVTKFCRIFLVSPRALHFGYPWRDTLAHELVHWMLIRKGGNSLPVWLHEGIARYLERIWIDPALPPDDPAWVRELAISFRDRGELIGLDRISPSMAFLPSQRHTTVAFYEVAGMIRLLAERHGRQALVRLVERIEAGLGQDEALAAVAGTSAEALWNDWLRTLPPKGSRGPAAGSLDLILFRESGDPGAADERSLGDGRARDHLKLGKLLKDRGRNRAALAEFRQARDLAGGVNLAIQNQLASVLLLLGRSQPALEAATAALADAPDNLPALIAAARAERELDRLEPAAGRLRAAIGVNPFDPQVRALLHDTLRRLGREAEAKEQAEALELIRRRLAGE